MQRARLTRGATAAIATAGLLVAVALPTAGGSSRTASCAAEARRLEPALARRLLELVDARRRSLGLRQLRAGPALARSATWKAAHMARNGYVAHTDLPGTRTLAQRLRSCGFAGAGWGEVLAAGHRRPRSVFRAWLTSPRHRAIIDARPWRAAGAGVARSRDGTLYWTLDFGA